MKAIIPIGGGEISLKSTLKIDEYIVSLIKKETKKVLFIPTASGDMVSYIEKFKAYYGCCFCFYDAYD